MSQTRAVPQSLPSRPPPVWRGLALLCATGVVWGTIGPAVALVHDRSSLSVLTTGAYRAVAALVVLGGAVLLTGRRRACVRMLREHPGRTVAVGALTATYQLLFFIAVVATGVSVATVIALGSAPVLLLLLDGLQRRRLPGRRRVAPVAAAVVGLALVGLAGGGAGPAHPALGAATALGSGIAYALSADLGAVLSEGYDGLAVAGTTLLFTGLVLVPGGLLAAWLRGEPMTTSDTGSVLLVVYLGVVTMALAYVLLFAGLRTTPSGTAVVATLLEPVTAVVIAVVALGERLSVAAAVGSVLIVAAIASLGRADEVQPRPRQGDGAAAQR